MGYYKIPMDQSYLNNFKQQNPNIDPWPMYGFNGSYDYSDLNDKLRYSLSIFEGPSLVKQLYFDWTKYMWDLQQAQEQGKFPNDLFPDEVFAGSLRRYALGYQGNYNGPVFDPVRFENIAQRISVLPTLYFIDLRNHNALPIDFNTCRDFLLDNKSINMSSVSLEDLKREIDAFVPASDYKKFLYKKYGWSESKHL